MNDADWVALIKRSPKQAQTLIAEEYRSLVYAVVLNKLRGSASLDEIEDCVSDAFAEIFGSISGFSANGTMKGFISTITARVAINAFKKSMYRKRMTSSIEDEDVELPVSGENTELSVHDRELRKRLWEIVDTLGEPDSRIIVYQFCYDLKNREIAEILSMNPYTVQKRSVRARKRIRKILEKEGLI